MKSTVYLRAAILLEEHRFLNEKGCCYLIKTCLRYNDDIASSWLFNQVFRPKFIKTAWYFNFNASQNRKCPYSYESRILALYFMHWMTLDKQKNKRKKKVFILGSHC